MDDQFNGRTDDDLFADDFEPVETQVNEATGHTTIDEPTSVVETSLPANTAEPTPTTKPAPTPNAPRSLAQSRHAKPAKPAHNQRPRKHSPKPVAIAPVASPVAALVATASPTDVAGQQLQLQQPVQDPSLAKNGTSDEASSPTSKKAQQSSLTKSGQNTAHVDRLASGGNPRTKLTESELAAKMEEMRILSAEKTRRFEQAERDSRSHALAYEKGMEEARRRRAEEAERRRRGEEERRRMDEERAANRERKLRAMGAKEGGSWDEGKAMEEERDRKTQFWGANGGVRGARSGASLAGSRFAEKDGDAVPREFGPDDFRGRGRGGRGGRGRGGGRGGRGGFNHDYERRGDGGGMGKPTPAHNGNGAQKPKPAQAPPTADEFPALPMPKKLDTSTKTSDAPPMSLLSPSLTLPPIGKWDDEMAALDEKKGS
ncbi:uncharacterized protein GGS25DRAFT_242026 [Hypoxylon fragiforme]|uniref:uncharacterized protein n=1 Tax=Hypoxylon fragiforme TaxID=63214 RepID=UPI0020C67F54|nr:uncharacterized protein GGS25DRAFT_242026 [Hypoxylon fragiforme]KAI2609998.1 hypothetical protein GGS25DRAFT_242026 [Hypoxylon fragiforme]